MPDHSPNQVDGGIWGPVTFTGCNGVVPATPDGAPYSTGTPVGIAWRTVDGVTGNCGPVAGPSGPSSAQNCPAGSACTILFACSSPSDVGCDSAHLAYGTCE
ncbi:MAG: hypothetical protein NVS3B10_00070 [Polyangiales bacterium]